VRTSVPRSRLLPVPGDDEQRVVDATARPSIAARIGVVEDRSVKPVAIVMPRTPTPTPTSAVSRFMPATASAP
jgi:hypothetical protein